MSELPEPFGLFVAPTAPRKPRRASARRRRMRLLLWLGLLAAVLALSFRPAQRIIIMTPAPPAPLPLAYPFAPSPNVDDRPPGTEVSCVVLHSTVVETVDDTVQVFLNVNPEGKNVSAHFIVGKYGRVVQMVPVEKRAWHAGISELDGAPRVNDFSVGIEMVNRNDGKDPYPDDQYQAVAGIIRFLRSRYHIPDARIVSHAEIALPPGRKSDPIGFDFEKLRALLRKP